MNPTTALLEGVRHTLVFVRWLIKRLLVPALAIVGGVVVIGLIIFAVVIAGGETSTTQVPDRVVLEVNLERRLIEYVPQDPLAQALLLTEKPLTLRDLTDGIQHAAGDQRVVGLITRVGAVPMGLATIQEVRDAIGLFTANGKFTIAFSESFGEFGPGTGAYYLASAFDEIYLQPSGDLGLTGLAYESPFLRGSFDKLKIEPRLLQRKEYKSFADMFLRRNYSDAHREAMQGLMKSQFDQIVSGIGTSRNMAATEVASIMDLAPFSASQALHHGFVDSLLYRDEVYGLVDDRSGSADRLYLRKYLERAGRPNQVGPTIALIYGIGPVHRGKTEFNPLDDSSTMGSSTVAAAFRDAVRDETVEAILFRVNSPGGSYVASDIIWREVVKARAAGKPVVVSMGDVAASGGYLVSVAANRIVAQPGTITGSIGVVAGKWLTRQFWREHAGVTWDAVQTSENSNLWSSLDDYTPEQLAKLNGILDRIYGEFTDKVAEGRNLDLSAVLPVAKGRVWTGEAAAARGLADTLGGLDLALRIARVEAGLNEDAPVTLAVFPREKEPLETIMKELFDQGPDNSDAMVQIVAARQILETLRPLYRAAVDAGLIDRGQVVRMPSAKVVW